MIVLTLFGVLGELFQNASYLFMSFKNPIFKKLKLMLNKLIHTGATLKVFEIFLRLVREFHSVSLMDFTEFDL